jgi:uncharacterized protein with HEPN domain
MRPGERDAAHLWDMLDAARRARRLTSGMDFAAFVADDRTNLAVERLLENIGEAASHLSIEFVAMHPTIPWKAMVGMRNVLAHQYGSVDQRLVWRSVAIDVPALVAFLEPLAGDLD